MKYLRATLIALAFAAASIAFGASAIDGSSEQGAAACQRCGVDIALGLVRTRKTCPQDCSGGTGTTAH